MQKSLHSTTGCSGWALYTQLIVPRRPAKTWLLLDGRRVLKEVELLCVLHKRRSVNDQWPDVTLLSILDMATWKGGLCIGFCSRMRTGTQKGNGNAKSLHYRHPLQPKEIRGRLTTGHMCGMGSETTKVMECVPLLWKGIPCYYDPWWHITCTDL